MKSVKVKDKKYKPVLTSVPPEVDICKACDIKDTDICGIIACASNDLVNNYVYTEVN